MKSGYSYRVIWQVAFPILISLLMEQLIGMTDTAFLGRVGEIELGASAIAGIFYMVIFMAAFGFSIGVQILIARRNGEGDYSGIGDLFYQGMYFQVGLAVALFVLSYFFSPLILRLLIASDAVCEAAVSYLNWRVFGALFSFTSVIFRAFFLGTMQTRTLTLNGVVMVLSNVAFNYVLIFGKFGFPSLGIAGAAIGSSLAEGVSLLFFVLYTRRKIDVVKYGLNRIPRVRFEVLRRIFRVSVWTMVQNVVSISTWFVFFLYVEHLGERALAVSNLVRNVSGILFMVTMAFGAACESMVSNLIGAGESVHVSTTIRRHVLISYAIVLPLVLLFMLFPEVVLGIYTDMAEVVDATIPSLWVMCATYVVTVPGIIYFQSVSGTGDTRSAFLMEFFTLCVYMVYITVIVLIMRADVAVCWTSELVYNGLILLIAYRFFKRGRWMNKRI